MRTAAPLDMTAQCIKMNDLNTGKRKRSGGRRPRAEWPAPYADVVRLHYLYEPCLPPVLYLNSFML